MVTSDLHCLWNRVYWRLPDSARPFRDWSLTTGRVGGATKREWWHVKFYPYEKGGQKKF